MLTENIGTAVEYSIKFRAISYRSVDLDLTFGRIIIEIFYKYNSTVQNNFIYI